jgi:hypothetical protein
LAEIPIGHFSKTLFYHNFFRYPDGFYRPIVFMPNIIDPLSNDLEPRIVFPIGGFGPLF